MAKQCINEILTENIPHGSRHTTAMVHNIGLTNGWIEVLKTILNKKCLQF